jgi:hypothetical protein
MEFPLSQLTISTNFTISDPVWPAEQLQMTALSSNTNFVRNEDIVFSGSGSNRVIAITRLADHFGTTTVTVTVTNPEGHRAMDSVNLNIAYFRPQPSFGAGVTSVGAVDFNNDGLLDVFHSHQLFLNNGDESYSNVYTFPGVQSGRSFWGDYNNDGYLDSLITDRDGRMRLFINTGNGTFITNLLSGLPVILDGVGTWGDYNNDGRPDLLLAGSTNLSVAGPNLSRVYRNNGNGTFTNIGTCLPGVELASVAWGDYDNDGRLDFAILGGYSGVYRLNITRIYHNNGDETFTDIQAGLPQLMQGVVAWGDYDNDGYLDLLVAGNAGRQYLVGPGLARVYHNNGDGAFTDINAGLAPVKAASAAWCDFDNDGFLDIVLSGEIGSNPVTRIYRNNGPAGTFTDIEASLPGQFMGLSEWGDYDNDGRLDLLLSWDGPTRIYLSTARLTNQAPSAPTNLAAAVSAHSNVWLTWAPAVDKESTNSSGLYYNLRVGTSPRGSQVFSPDSDPVTGRRKLANFGNAGHSNRWLISNLPRGTYYWSVQAIDAGLAGGAFADESSFNITNDLDFVSNHAPLADPQTITLAEDTAARITLSASDADGDPVIYSILKPPAYGVLTGRPPDLTYSPFANYFGADSFDYRVYDGLAVSSNASITISVTPVADIPNVTVSCALSYSPDIVVVVLNGEPYQGYSLEASTDLVHWAEIYSYTTQVTSVGYPVSATNRQFFRSRTVP